MLNQTFLIQNALKLIKQAIQEPGNYEKIKLELTRIFGKDDLITNLQKMKSVPAIMIDKINDDGIDCIIVENGLYHGVAGGVQAEVQETHTGQVINIPHAVLIDLKATIDSLVSRAGLDTAYNLASKNFFNLRTHLAAAPHNSINAFGEYTIANESVKLFIKQVSGVDLNPDEINALWQDISDFVDVFLYPHETASNDYAVTFYIGNELIAFNSSTIKPEFVILPFSERSPHHKVKLDEFAENMKGLYNEYLTEDNSVRSSDTPEEPSAGLLRI